MNLHHIGYLVKDVSKSIHAFEQLGYTLQGQVCFDPDRKAKICFLVESGSPIELVSPEPESDLFPLLKQYQNQPYHLCYTISDLEAKIENLKNAGFLLFKAPQKAVAIGPDAIVAFLMHRSIGMIELVQLHGELK